MQRCFECERVHPLCSALPFGGWHLWAPLLLAPGHPSYQRYTRKRNQKFPDRSEQRNLNTENQGCPLCPETRVETCRYTGN